MGREMTTFRWKKSPQYLNNSTQFGWKMEIHRLDPLPSLVYSKSSTWSILVDRKKSTRWKSMVRTRLQISLFGWIEKSTRWKRSMVRTRLQLGLFEWIEKSTPWKRSNGPNQTSTWPILVDWKIYAVEKKVWSEPDSTLAYLGGTKNPHGGKEVWSEPDFDLAYFGGLKNPRGGEKKVWSEPDFDLAYFGGSKKKHDTEQVGILRNVKCWWKSKRFVRI